MFTPKPGSRWISPCGREVTVRPCSSLDEGEEDMVWYSFVDEGRPAPVYSRYLENFLHRMTEIKQESIPSVPLTREIIEKRIKTLEQEILEQKSLIEKLPKTIQYLEEGETLKDGSFILRKERGIALLVAPKETEAFLTWHEREDVFSYLPSGKDAGWFIPSVEMLQLAKEKDPSIGGRLYWSNEVFWGEPKTRALTSQGFHASMNEKINVRAFRCVVFV